jgi:hypothetical protein
LPRANAGHVRLGPNDDHVILRRGALQAAYLALWPVGCDSSDGWAWRIIARPRAHRGRARQLRPPDEPSEALLERLGGVTDPVLGPPLAAADWVRSPWRLQEWHLDALRTPRASSGWQMLSQHSCELTHGLRVARSPCVFSATRNAGSVARAMARVLLLGCLHRARERSSKNR